jgi:hypothetical protein
MSVASNRETLAALIQEMVKEVRGCSGRDGHPCQAMPFVETLESLAREGSTLDENRALFALDALLRQEREAWESTAQPHCRTVYLAGHALGLAALLNNRSVSER